MFDLVIPAAHQPWCEDRDKPRSQDHMSEGIWTCLSTMHHDEDIVVWLEESPGNVATICIDDFAGFEEADERCTTFDGALTHLLDDAVDAIRELSEPAAISARLDETAVTVRQMLRAALAGAL